MKVNVVTVNEIKIRRFRWWSDWIDVCVFDWDSTGYLLQMKVSRFNKKKFAHRQYRGIAPMDSARASVANAGDLTQMNSPTDKAASTGSD